MSGYTPTGPWTAGSAPGISAAFLGNLESFIQQLEGDTGSVVVTGSVSGTTTLYEVLQGTFKMVFVNVANFSDAGTKNLALPVAFTVGALGFNNNIGRFQLLAATVSQGVDVFTSLAVGGGSTTGATGNTVHDTSIWACKHAFDTYSVPTGTAATGYCFFIGI